MQIKIQLFVIISFSIIILSSFILSNIAISNIRNEIKNYNYVLSNALSSALILGSENVEDIIENIPFGIIITDDKDSIKFFRNLNSNQNLYKIKEDLEKRNQFVEIVYENFKIGRIYYSEPKSIFYLSILPFILTLIAIGTFVIVILALRNAYIYESERFYSTFAKGLAHQIGTPISSLIANFELLKRGNDRFFEIEKNLERISSILKRFSKIGSSINFREVNLNEIILSAYNNLKDKFSREVKLEIEGNVKIKGDFELLEWVFENFIKNSYEANALNIKILISKNKKNCIIDIIDDGAGISSKIKKKLFSESITTKKEGWGIGLVLIKRIIKMHKGKVKLLESREGFTKFRIEFKI